MLRFIYLLPVFALVLSSCTSTPEVSDAAELPPLSEEEMTINQVVLDVYAALGFEEGGSPDFEAIADYFTPTATMYHFRYDTLAAFDVTIFIDSYKGAVDGGAMTAFSEVELGGITEHFGNVAHRMSSYASYVNGSDEIVERGVNSFQLLKIDGEWIVNSVIWDIEKDGQPIPDRFLNN